jgi:hypothetical protein
MWLRVKYFDAAKVSITKEKARLLETNKLQIIRIGDIFYSKKKG